jgi:Tol biopolymer transport system component
MPQSPASEPRAKLLSLAILALLLLLPGTGLRPDFRPTLAVQAPAIAVSGRIALVRDGNIYVADLSSGAQRQLTGDGTDAEPRWSHSGQWIAYRDGNEVQVVRADGSGQRGLSAGTNISQFAWSPSADTLAFVAGGLFTESADGAEQATLVPAPEDGRYGAVIDLAWSPDGAWIAFDQTDVPQPPNSVDSMSLRRIRPDGSEATEVFDTNTPAGALTLAGWSPDGRQLLFWPHVRSASLLADGAPLDLIAAQGGMPEQIVQIMLAYRDFVAWDPAGSGRLAVVEGGGREAWTGKSLHLLAPATGSDTTLTGPDASVSSPAWSPDGRLLAYVSMPDPGSGATSAQGIAALMNRRIELFDATTQVAPRVLTDDRAYRDESPQWTPAGSAIRFVRVDESNNVSLWAVSATGGAPQELVDSLSQPSKERGGVAGYFGHVDWSMLFDWWTPANTQ